MTTQPRPVIKFEDELVHYGPFSQIAVFVMSTDGVKQLVCSGCVLSELRAFKASDGTAMHAHLLDHRQANHLVRPDDLEKVRSYGA